MLQRPIWIAKRLRLQSDLVVTSHKLFTMPVLFLAFLGLLAAAGASTSALQPPSHARNLAAIQLSPLAFPRGEDLQNVLVSDSAVVDGVEYKLKCAFRFQPCHWQWLCCCNWALHCMGCTQDA